MRASTKDHWDRFWRDHAEVDEVYSNEDRLIGQILALMDVRGKEVLEVGAGSGRDAIRLAKMGARVTIIDYVHSSFDLIRRTAAREGAEIRMVCGDATRMPFPEGKFDLVFHQGLMEHFRDPQPLLRENTRILKEGGRLLVDVPQTFHIYTVAKHILIAMGKWFAGWETEYTIGQLEGLIRRQGLTVVARYGDWMVPGFFYRALRRTLANLRIAHLPLYPRGIPPFSTLAERFRGSFRKSPLSFYTYAMIGAVGEKRSGAIGAAGAAERAG
jgi:ubiquinone/menaquinone biosynthesis C-methylase UbiE